MQKPTRHDKASGGEHLLDLVLTDLGDAVHCEVEAKLADHALVLAKLMLEVSKQLLVEREK